MQANEIENMIREQFPNASITITDLAGDGNHYSAEVIDESFKDMNRVQQQRASLCSLKRQNGWFKRRTTCISTHNESPI